MTLPVLDLSQPISSLAPAVDQACRDVGFFAVVGHGVPHDVISAAWSEMEAFFALDDAAKLSARHRVEPHHPYGYFPAGQEALAASLGIETPPDIKESFNVAPPVHHADGTGRFGQVERIWPTEPVGLRAAWTAYYAALVSLSERLLGIMAAALDIDPKGFAATVDEHLSALRGLHYPPLEAPALPGQLRAGEHSDYGTLTILLPGAGTGGLEVLRADGEWVPVQPIENGFIVNLGDMMQRWTNDRWRSTRHRVAIPDPAAAAIEHRYSIAFFHQPNWDAEISAIETCVTVDRPAAHEPVLAGPWLAGKFDAASTGST
jgi:isopenicillin N synthase-like dioxygenase